MLKKWENWIDLKQIKLLDWIISGAGKEIDSSTPEYQKAKYIIAVMYENVSKFIVTGLIAILLGVGQYFIFFTIVYGSLKVLAYGAHLQNSFTCLITGTIIYFGSIYLSIFISNYDIAKSPYLYIIVFAICYFLFILYAPAVSKEQYLKQERNKKLKKILICYLPVIYILAVFLSPIYRLLLTFSVIAETMNILPLTFLIFEGRR